MKIVSTPVHVTGLNIKETYGKVNELINWITKIK
jgi:hypothetical protein